MTMAIAHHGFRTILGAILCFGGILLALYGWHGGWIGVDEKRNFLNKVMVVVGAICFILSFFAEMYSPI